MGKGRWPLDVHGVMKLSIFSASLNCLGRSGTSAIIPCRFNIGAITGSQEANAANVITASFGESSGERTRLTDAMSKDNILRGVLDHVRYRASLTLQASSFLRSCRSMTRG